MATDPQSNNSFSEQHERHDLPVYIPLSHSNPYLTAETFDVDGFLLSRTHMSLPELRSELRDYLLALKEELVKLINDDYEAFISLSTDLKGEGSRLERMKQPLESIKAQIIESKNELQIIQDGIQDKLAKRATLREEKMLLHLLLKISESVTRLESLLLSSPTEDATSRLGTVKSLPQMSTVEESNIGDRTRGNRAKHLGRVAAEYTQLLYHVSKARADRCIFVDEIQWRINRIQSSLSSDLDYVFGAILAVLTKGKSSEEKAKWTADLTECLRAYDILGLWRDAEEILRRQLVVGFVKKLPTLLLYLTHLSQGKAAIPLLARLIPHSPPSPHFLDDAENSLARLYNQLLRFVERDLSQIMEIAEKVSVKPIMRLRVEGNVGGIADDNEKAGNDGFEIMANVVWAGIGTAIMDELGGVVFCAGRPNDFRKHHEVTHAFIHSLEFLAPSLHSIQAMRSHPVYVAFDRRWQHPVYLQMRWKEIVPKLEDALAVTRIEPVSSKERHVFVTSQAGAVWTALMNCWSGEVYIPELSHRFWKLTLQLLSRYKTWLDSTLPMLDTASKTATTSANDRTVPGSPGPLVHSGALVDTSSADISIADDTLLKQCAAAIVDINAMHFHVIKLWQEEICVMLPEAVGDRNDCSPEDILRHTLSSLTSLAPSLSDQIVAIMTRRCCDALLPVRSIPSQFRAMSHKRVPAEPSHFVPSILRPVKMFFGIVPGDGLGEPLREDYLDTYATDVFESVSQRYMYYLTAMKKTEESLRRLKKGKKSTFSLFGTSNSGKDEEGRDEERIKAQMILDVEAFGEDAKTLGIDIDASDTFEALKVMVHLNSVDGD